MPIKLHCSSCGKKMEAPDSAGGKWGKCPACHAKIYVPSPQIEEDELKLAPVDETEEQKRKQLMLETYRLDLPYGWWTREPLTPGRLFHRG